MKISNDGRYKIFQNCANDITTGATIAVWVPATREPHPSYPETSDFLALYGDEIPEAEQLQPDPNWGAFRVAMLVDTGYLRVTLLAAASPSGSLAVSRVENTIAMDSPNLAVLQVLWEQVLANVSALQKPSVSEVATWNTIASNAAMPFTFQSSGLIQPS